MEWKSVNGLFLFSLGPDTTYRLDFTVHVTVTHYIFVSNGGSKVVQCNAVQCTAVECSEVQCSARERSTCQKMHFQKRMLEFRQTGGDSSAVQCSAVQCRQTGIAALGKIHSSEMA
jgi:hypothetical protein